MNMNPSWLIVEYASTFLMSCCTHASRPPRSAVATPITSIALSTAGAASKIGSVRATTNTPAATIVAAWMSADAGVGPAIASGSQTCSGTCADLPIAAHSRPTAAAVAAPGAHSGIVCSTSGRSKVPTLAKITNRAIRKPRSPTRVVRNAFWDALRGPSSSYQNPMSR